MTIFYDNREFETLSFSRGKNDDDRYKMTQNMVLKTTTCTHCTERIVDQYYYEVDGLSWHSSCLRCYACHTNLSNMRSCFRKNQKTWCKKDYNKLFHCWKCQELLKPSDLIMRCGTDGLPYHVGCFRCCLCDVLLLAGDPYGCSNDRLFCKSDFLANQQGDATKSESTIDKTDNAVPSSNEISILLSSCNDRSQPTVRQSSIDECIKTTSSTVTKKLKIGKDSFVTKLLSMSHSNNEDRSADDSSSDKEYTPLEPREFARNGSHNFGDSDEAMQEKSSFGNQSKSEKFSSPQSTFEPEDRTVDDTICSSETDLGKEAIDHNSTLEASTFGTEEDDVSGESCSVEDSDDKITVSGKQSHSKKSGNNSRQKRVRTSFKHQQLRTMKAYFAMNHNPDSKDLRQLSQKTGLSKRVLQVWFQNARAKFRRSLCRQSGIMCPPSSNQMPMPSVFDDPVITMDKNGNYSSKSKMAAFGDLSHSGPSPGQRMCNIPEMGYSNLINNGSLIPTLTNLRDRYLPNGGKQFLPTSNFYSSPMNIGSMDVGNLASNLGLVDFSRDNSDSFHLTELGMGQKL